MQSPYKLISWCVLQFEWKTGNALLIPERTCIFWYQVEWAFLTSFKHLSHWRKVAALHLLTRWHIFSWGTHWPKLSRQSVLKSDCDLVAKHFIWANSSFNLSFCGRHCLPTHWIILVRDFISGSSLFIQSKSTACKVPISNSTALPVWGV